MSSSRDRSSRPSDPASTHQAPDATPLPEPESAKSTGEPVNNLSNPLAPARPSVDNHAEPSSTKASVDSSSQTASTPSTPLQNQANSTPAGDDDLASEIIAMRQQPIPPPSESKQYRAIGLIRGRYVASPEQFTRGTLVATDGTPIDAVLLGRVMSLVKKHLDLEQEHLWVVYPRTREKNSDLHAQIVGVWEPEKLSKSPATAEETTAADSEQISTQAQSGAPAFTDGYFSIRGEVIYQGQDNDRVIIKIRQSPRKESDEEKAFKLQLIGTLANKAVGHFWNLHVQRQGNMLVIQGGESIGVLPPRKKSQQAKEGPRKGPPLNRQREFQRPSRPGVGAKSPMPISQPARKEPLPKPVKRKTSEDAGS